MEREASALELETFLPDSTPRIRNSRLRLQESRPQFQNARRLLQDAMTSSLELDALCYLAAMFLERLVLAFFLAEDIPGIQYTPKELVCTVCLRKMGVSYKPPDAAQTQKQKNKQSSDPQRVAAQLEMRD